MLKRKSIIFSTYLVGAIAGILLIIATFLSIELSVFIDKRNEVHRAVMLYDLLFMQHPNKEEFEIYRLKHKLTPVAGESMTKVKEQGTMLIEDPLFRKTLQSGDIAIYVYDNHYYYAYKMDTMFYYRSDEPMTPYRFYILLVSIVLLFLLLALFHFTKASIAPLRELYIQIQRFAKGEKGIHIEVEGNDEVAQVANAFNESVKRNHALQRSRSLFLRNVMHELKTPISKGKLLIHFIEGEAKDIALLENLFEQMQGHLDDLVRVESLSEKNLELNKRTYALIDIVDKVIDSLDIAEGDVCVNITDEVIEVDFKLFSYAIKNLLDNALKYTDEKPIDIFIENGCLIVANKGKAFKYEIGRYFRAYERDMTQHSLEGMGLGLYIVQEIVKKHDFELSYTFSEGKHLFSISF